MQDLNVVVPRQRKKSLVEQNVSIPVLTNTRVIQAGEELLIFNAKLAKERLTMEPASDSKRKLEDKASPKKSAAKAAATKKKARC